MFYEKIESYYFLSLVTVKVFHVAFPDDNIIGRMGLYWILPSSPCDN